MKLLTNKFFILGNLFLILIAIPITLFFIGKQQETRSRAAASTVLYFPTTSQTVPAACANLTADVMVDPGQNVVSIVDMYLTYDVSVLAITGITPSSEFSTIVREASLSNGAANISVSVGSDTSKAVRTITKVATITFKTISGTAETSSISFDTTKTRAFSLSSADQPTENVLSNASSKLNVTINPSISCSGATTSGAPSANNAPVCSGLVLDRSATGAAPYSITFTAAGNDTDGTITKAAFSFGDGKTGEVTTGSGIGTNTINAPISHTFQDAGTYNVTASLTDNQNATSATTTCTATVTVTAGTTTTGGETTTTGTTNAAPVCTDFTVTPATGSAPLITLLTARGNDPDGLITKTTFNFGDGQTQDVTTGMNIQSVSPQTNHTYTTSGNFNATVTFTDNASGVSTICAKTVTVSGTSTSEPVTVTAAPTIAQPGASATTIGVIGGIILTILGGVLLLSL